MGITVGNISISGSVGNGGTFYHNVSGDDRFLYVIITSQGGLDSAPSGTLNNVAMPRYVSPQFAVSQPLAVWFVANPPTGTNTVKLWWQWLNRDVAVYIVTFNGVHQTAPMSSGTQWNRLLSNTTGFATTGTANENEMFIDLASGYDTALAYTIYPVSGQTTIASLNHPNAGNRFKSNLTATLKSAPSGTFVGQWALSGTTVDSVRAFGMALRPSSSTPPTGTGATYGIQFRSYIIGLGD